MSAAPAIPEQLRPLYDKAPRSIQVNCRLWLGAIAAMDCAERGQKLRIARIYGRRLGVQVSTVVKKRVEFHAHGPLVLLDKRFSSECWKAAHCECLPKAAIAYLTELAATRQLGPQGAIRVFVSQLQRWQNGDALAQIPGWRQPPQGNPPPGCSTRNLMRHLRGLPKPVGGKVRYEIVIQVHYNGKVTCFKRKPAA